MTPIQYRQSRDWLWRALPYETWVVILNELPSVCLACGPLVIQRRGEAAAKMQRLWREHYNGS